MPTSPTHVRYLIVLVAMLAAVLLYLERVCVSVAEVYIREDLRIGKMEMDAAFGAFFIAYALAQVPSGWLSQRYGPRAMMTLYLIGWSVFGVFIALAQDFWTLFAARFLLGLSQAGAYPTAALLVKRWVPDRRRGLASGIVAFGGRIGGAGANAMTGFLIVAFVPITAPATVTPVDVLDTESFRRLAETPLDQSAFEWRHGTETTKFIRHQVRFDLKVAVAAKYTGQVITPQHYTPELIADVLNNSVRDPKLTGHQDWSGLTLSADGTAIAAKPSADRTQAESERLNRLVLEKLFPGSIRQLHVEGWRPTLLLYGILGILVGGVFWVVARDWPRKHPWANANEVALIESGQSQESQTAGSDAIPWRELIASRNQWFFSATNFFSNLGWVFLITLMPRFLAERFSVPVEQRGLMTTLPLLVASFGLIAGGWYTDRITRTLGKWLGRAIPMGAFKFPCAAVLAISTLLPDPWTVTIALAVMAICQDFGVPAIWAFAQDTGGKQAATVLGWGNMWGNFGAGLGPSLVGGIAATWGWDAALFTGAFAFVMCGIAGMMTNAAESLFPSDEAQP
jgi:ACS family glucarate transporter-like MFS transporter